MTVPAAPIPTLLRDTRTAERKSSRPTMRVPSYPDLSSVEAPPEQAETPAPLEELYERVSRPISHFVIREVAAPRRRDPRSED